MAEYLVVFTDGAPEALVAFFRDRCAAAGLRAAVDVRRIVVSAPPVVLAHAAETQRLVKPNRDGRPGLFCAESGLWKFSEAEAAFLLEELLFDVAASEAPPGPVDAALARESLLEACRAAGVVEDAFPLHGAGRRSCSCWRWLGAPAAELQAYFGTEVALYFAWMNYVQRALLVPAAAGLAVYTRRLYTGDSIDDDAWAPVYALLVCLWGACFCKGWRRAEAVSGCVCLLGDLGTSVEVSRPQASALAFGDALVKEGDDASARPRHGFEGVLRTSPVTGREERYYPRWRRQLSYCASAAVSGLMLGVAFLWHIASLNLQGYIRFDKEWEEWRFFFPRLAALADEGAVFDPNQERYMGLLALVPTVIHVLVVLVMSEVYKAVAGELTRRENHVTEKSHEDACCGALLVKRFVFEAADAYAGLFFLAFVQMDVVKLRSELVAIYTVDSLRRVALESLLPLVLGAASRAAAGKKDDRLGAADLEAPEYEEFDDFLEMVIEFGYVVLFASVFPLGAALTVVANAIEVRSDCWKLMNVYRRPPARRARTIGAWASLLQGIVYIACITNCVLFAFGSEQMSAWFPSLFARVALTKAGFTKAGAKRAAETTGTVAAAGKGRVGVRVAGVLDTRRDPPMQVVVLIAVAIEHLLLLFQVGVSFIPSESERVKSEVARIKYEGRKPKPSVRRSSV